LNEEGNLKFSLGKYFLSSDLFRYLNIKNSILVIENSAAQKSLKESKSNAANDEDAYGVYLKETCDANIPERTLMRLYPW